MTFGVEGETPFLVPGDLDPVLDVFTIWWQDELSDHMAGIATLTEIKATSLNSSTAPTKSAFSFTPASGTGSGAPVQDSVATVITTVSDLRGRSYRGRNYVPAGIAAGLSNSSTWSPLWVADLQADWEALGAALIDASFQHVVLSRYQDGAWLTTGVSTPITAYVGRSKIGTVRSRVLGTGA